MNPDQLTVGAFITPRAVPLSLQRLVMEAGANRDFAPIHHDMEAARQAGAPGAFTNYVFLQSLVEFTLRDWAGPAALIDRVALKLGGFNAVGMTLRCSGEILELAPAGDYVKARISLQIHADDRITTTGECEVRLLANPTA